MTTDRLRGQGGGGRRVPARVRIMAWVMLLMAVVLAMVNVVVWKALDAETQDRVDRASRQEIGEFQEFAAVGVDPGSAQRSATLPPT